jgi:hypothetical protein
MGRMNMDIGIKIGDMVGDNVDVEVEEDGNAMGEFLRRKATIKICVDVRFCGHGW